MSLFKLWLAVLLVACLVLIASSVGLEAFRAWGMPEYVSERYAMLVDYNLGDALQWVIVVSAGVLILEVFVLPFVVIVLAVEWVMRR